MSLERHEMHEQDVGAYVLGALSDEEHTRFVRHLVECPVCRDEVDRLQVAADALPRSVTPLAAPASLKAAIMGEVQADVREREPASLGRRLRDRLSRLPAVPARVASATAVVLLVLGLAGGFGLSQVTSGDDERTVTASFDTDSVVNGSGNLVISRRRRRRRHPARARHAGPEEQRDLPGVAGARRGGHPEGHVHRQPGRRRTDRRGRPPGRRPRDGHQGARRRRAFAQRRRPS